MQTTEEANEAAAIAALITALNAVDAPRKPRATVLELLARPSRPLGTPLSDELDVLLDQFREVDGLVEPLRALASTQKAGHQLYEVAARALIMQGKLRAKAKRRAEALDLYEQGLAVLGKRWTVRAQELWALAMTERVRLVESYEKAGETLDEMWKLSPPENGYCAERLLEATVAWVGRAAAQKAHEAIVERIDRALELRIPRPVFADRYRIDLGGRLALAHRHLFQFEQGIAAVRQVLQLQKHARATPAVTENFTWAMAEGAYQAIDRLLRPEEGRAFTQALREVLGANPTDEHQRIELAYGVVMEARAAFLQRDFAQARARIAEALSISPASDPHAASAAKLLEGDLALAEGDRDAARRHYTELIARHGGTTDAALREDANRAHTNLGTI